MGEQKPFRVDYGCISLDDRLDSRDVGESEFFDTPRQVNEFLDQRKLDFDRLGYKLWAVSINQWTGKEYRKINEGNTPHIDIPK